MHMMTSEERLDKLTERVDAIAEHVQILSGMQVETERKLQAFMESVNTGLVRFALILSNHEDRIEQLEAS